MPSSTCAKVLYPSLRTAAVALRDIKASGDPRRGEVAVHLCPHCRGFHLTSNRKSVKNKWMRMAETYLTIPSPQTAVSR